MKTFLTFAVIFAAAHILKAVLGIGAMLVVAMSVLSFCVGMLWQAGRDAEKGANP